MGGYGANCKTAEESEAEYRAKREEAKVWRRERDEADRQVQEMRALQARVYCDDVASRVKTSNGQWGGGEVGRAEASGEGEEEAA